MRKAVLENYSDLEFLSLVDKIARDYKTLLSHIFDDSIDVSNSNDLTASRILMACYQAEEPMSGSDMEQFLRLEDVDFSRALIKLIGLQYAMTEDAQNKGQGKIIKLTPSGAQKAKQYEALFKDLFGNADMMSSLLLTDVERDNILLSLIALQNRTTSLLRKVPT